MSDTERISLALLAFCMSVPVPAHEREMTLADAPQLPPLLTGHPVEAGSSVFERARQGARDGLFRAGDFLWSRDRERVAFTLVLEPEIDPEHCAQMLFLAMVAAVDAIGARLPPEIALTHRWPNILLANGAVVGEGRVAWSETGDANGTPDWMIVGLFVRLAPIGGELEPGQTPELTSLFDEGAGGLDSTQALESISRHLLTWLNRWEHDGFSHVVEAWLYRADGYLGTMAVDTGAGRSSGRFLGLDECGNLLLKQEGPEGGTRAVMLDTALAHAETEKGPRT